MFAREFNFDIQGSAVRDTMPPDIGFAVLSYANDTSVFRVELPYCVVDGIAAVSAEGCDYLVL